MKNEKGQEVIKWECKGEHIDDDCMVKNCKNAQYHCIIQELKKQQEGNIGGIFMDIKLLLKCCFLTMCAVMFFTKETLTTKLWVSSAALWCISS